MKEKFFKKENLIKLLVLLIIIIAIISVYIYKQNKNNNNEYINNNLKDENIINKDLAEELKIPIILEFGHSSCPACVDMIPILEEIEKEYKDKIQIKKIDVYKQNELSSKYNIFVIPTQVFLDKNGEEVFRNQGILSAQEIRNKLKEMEIF